MREIVGDPVGIVSGYSFRELELQPQDHLENDNFLEKSRPDGYAKVQEETRWVATRKGRRQSADDHVAIPIQNG